MVRYNANGTLDTTFGTNGKVLTNPAGQGMAYLDEMAVDGSGRVVLGGVTDSVATLVRYTPNGALDTSFGTGGVLISNVSALNSNVQFALQPDGKVVVATAPNYPMPEFITARFNADGTADSTFGSGGVVVTSPAVTSVGISGVTIQSDDKVVVSGGTPQGLALLRYTVGGSLDATFGTGGTVSVPLPDGGAHHGGGLVVQADGKIIVGGNLTDGAPNSAQFFGALRVNPDGSVDTGYGNGGWAMVQLSPGAQEHAMALEPDGRVVLVGYTNPNWPNGPVDIVLVRFLGSAPQIGSFTASPNPVTANSLVTLTASSITDGNPNSTIMQVAFYYIDGTGTKQVLGYGTSDGLGDWTRSITVSLPPGSYTLYAQAEDSDGVFGDPFALALTVQ
jgi:uncharacterized delta-60 repeat protein